MADLLRCEDLRVTLAGREVLAGVDLAVDTGESLALVGPSGCGKSVLTRALLGLLPSGAAWRGSVSWRGERLTDPRGSGWGRVRGRGMSLVLQEPQTGLNPVLTVGEQISETVRVHHRVSGGEADRRAVSLLEEMLVPDPAAKARCYPHQLSGGMRQRVLLAAAMACDPELLIADEPTTALDVTVQREILALINRIRRRRGMALLFITHDTDLVPLVADRKAEMDAGRIVAVTDLRASAETGAAGGGPPPGRKPGPARRDLFTAQGGGPVLKARNIRAGYGERRRPDGGARVNLPVSGVDVDLSRGRALGIAGESGCGKTTLARVLSGHLAPVGGTLELEGEDFMTLRGDDLRRARRRVQLMFQDPAGSLNPRQKVGDALGEAADDRSPAVAAGLLEEVGLAPDVARRFPHQLSGGQRQRVALARHLAADPSVLIADEPTSALDRETRERILALLRSAMDRRGLALVMIAHDFAVLHAVCDDVAVMFGGMVVESYRVADRELARHPYTLEMMAAAPSALIHDTRSWAEAGGGVDTRDRLAGTGCPRAGRCPLQKPHCVNELPRLLEVAAGHRLRCPEATPGGHSLFIDT